MSVTVTYQQAYDIIQQLEASRLPIGRHLPEKLKELKSDVKIEKKLSNFVCRVRKHHAKNRDMNMSAEVVPSEPKLGPFCSALGLTTEILLQGADLIHIPENEVTVGPVYELEKFRRDKGIPFNAAHQWCIQIFGERASNNQKRTSIASAFSRVFTKILNLKRRGGKVAQKALCYYHKQQFRLPRPSSDAKLTKILPKTIAPLTSSVSPESLLLIDEKQGELGHFTKTRISVMWNKRAINEQQNVDIQDMELIHAEQGEVQEMKCKP